MINYSQVKRGTERHGRRKKMNTTIKEQGYQLTAYERYGICGMGEYVEMLADQLEVDASMIWEYNEFLNEQKRYDDYVYLMDELNGVLECLDAWEILELGRNSHDEFSAHEEYFKFNGYGNLVSFSEYEFMKMLESDEEFKEWHVKQELDEEEAREIIGECNMLIAAGF